MDRYNSRVIDYKMLGKIWAFNSYIFLSCSRINPISGRCQNLPICVSQFLQYYFAVVFLYILIRIYRIEYIEYARSSTLQLVVCLNFLKGNITEHMRASLDAFFQFAFLELIKAISVFVQGYVVCAGLNNGVFSFIEYLPGKGINLKSLYLPGVNNGM